ncbi:protein LURP-one-related 10-like [Lycium ferocissimum]|uniref:protein LURP-one-related 10-like n=1 Tax=Lycium ferocissimum TaxID=112874 RepID=UPI002815B3F3|nr:protein LURP-one-related 10-like [Lycium ferocissimum]
MAESTYVVMPNNPIAVIGSQYCAPNQVDLVISRKVKTLRYGEFVVSDMNGNLMFKVRGGQAFAWHDKRVILDAAGNPMVNLKQKILSEHSRWNVFRGENTDDKDFLFTVKTTSIFQWKTKLAVFLANNNSKEKDCDFLIKGSWSDKSCAIYAGDSSTIVAQMHKKITAKSLLIGKDNFMVTVYPNVDQAFIVSLIVILDAINAPVAAAAAAGAAIGTGISC